MFDLPIYQLVLIGLCFIWSGFVRSWLGFGGSVLTLPFLLLIYNQPLVFLPIISVHLLVFAALTIHRSHRKQPAPETGLGGDTEGSVNWKFLRYALVIMIIPKIIGVLGLIVLPTTIMNVFIFGLIFIYAWSYIFDRQFKSQSKFGQGLLLIIGGYVSGASLMAAPLVASVFASNIKRHQLRDSMLALWFVLVSIKLTAFIWVGVDLQLIHHLWLFPCAYTGHLIGLHLHDRMLLKRPVHFYRLLGLALLTASSIGLWTTLA